MRRFNFSFGRKRRKEALPRDEQLSFRPALERLEEREAPALLANQFQPLIPPPAPPAASSTLALTANQVGTLLDRAAAATASDNAIVAVVDRSGTPLGIRVEGNVSPAITSNLATEVFAIDGALAEARTAAFFSSNQAPLSSRTVQFISQSTITQREVQSNPDIPDHNSPLWGPGLVGPIGDGGHFPPGVMFTPLVDLFAIEQTNRDTSTINGTTLPSRFNVPTQYVPAGTNDPPPDSYGYISGLLPSAQPRGVGTLPGGIPLYENGVLVGGIGVFFPGTTGYASEENSSLSSTYDPSKPDLSLEAEFIAFVAAGGSSAAGYSFGSINGIPALPGFDLPFGRIDLAGITLDIYGPGGLQGPTNLVNYAFKNLSVGQGNPFSGVNVQVTANPNQTLINGVPPSFGWLVLPHAGGDLTAADVTQMIVQGVNAANQTRAQIRLPIGVTAKMVFAVTDSSGDVLGLYNMPDATIFSIAVSVAKARNAAYYDDPTQLLSVDMVPGIPDGASFTARTFRYLASPYFPEGIDYEPPGPFSALNDPGVNRKYATNDGPPLPASFYTSILAHDAFFPNSNFHDPNNPLNQNGVVFFPGSLGVYKIVNGVTKIVGGLGVSGDGVNQDDVVTAFAGVGFSPPDQIRVDQFLTPEGIRLPFLKFPRNPFDL